LSARDLVMSPLRVEHLTKRYRTADRRFLEAVSDVSFEVQAGECVGLLGPNGAGKSTAIRCISGFYPTSSGRILIGGVDVHTDPKRARQILGMCSQEDTLDSDFRVLDQLARHATFFGLSGAEGVRRGRELLERFGIADKANELIESLSGGMKRRLQVARALIASPKVLVLDEPTTGLDVMTQARVLELVSGLIAAYGTAAVYVTHDLAVVAGLAHRIAVMYSGLFMEEGAAETLLREPVHPYTRRLVQSTPSLHTRTALVGIGGSPLNPKDRTDACPFAPRCDYASDACIERLPSLDVLGGGHRVRCARAGEILEAVAAAGAAAGDGVWSAHTAHDDSALVDVRALCAFYGENEVLHGVELSIGEGECLALVGESGSGKTTLGRCISGLHVGGATGEIRFGGSPIPLRPAQRTEDVRRAIQYVFQSPYASLNPRHRIGRSIAMPLEVFGLEGGKTRERVRELLARVNLDPSYEARYPSQLSGGERQRVAIARALAAEPRVLVCDEVTSALDVSTQASILELLRELRHEMHLTILFITHHLPLVRAVADRAVIMRDGAIVEQGSAESLLDNPQDVYTRELISSTPVLG